MHKCLALLSVLLLLSSSRGVPSTSLFPASDEEGIELVGASRFIFAKNCDSIRKDDGSEEECCSGNFKCTHKACDGKGGFCNGFLKHFLWCHSRECKPRSKNDIQESESPTPSPSASGNGDNNPSPTPSIAPTLSVSPTPSGTVNALPSSTPVATVFAQSPSPSPSTSTSPSISPIISPSAIPSFSPTPSPEPATDDPLNCVGIRRRREIRDLSLRERQRWSDAIRRLMDDRNERGDSEWDRLVRLHQRNGDEAHGGCYFLPWHRLFLLKLENALRRFEPDLNLPYWDWTRDSEDPARSQVWGQNFVGGAEIVNRQIPNGPFAGLRARYPREHRVARNFTSGRSGGMRSLWSWRSIRNVLRQNRWQDFADGIESAHVIPHLAVGGDMRMTHDAPNDPVFYLHHAYVDLLYDLRQRTNGRQQFGGTHDFAAGTERCNADRVLRAFGVPARTAFNLQCVEYATPQTRGSNGGVAGRTRNAVRLDCNDPEFIRSSGLAPERCNHGNQILLE